MNMSRFCSLYGFVFAMILALIGCAGSHSSNTSTGGNTGSSAISVSISPASATVPAGATQQFSASVQNSSNQAVTWSVDGVSGGNSASGTVSSSGLYTAPATAGSHNLTATSAADSSALQERTASQRGCECLGWLHHRDASLKKTIRVEWFLFWFWSNPCSAVDRGSPYGFHSNRLIKDSNPAIKRVVDLFKKR